MRLQERLLTPSRMFGFVAISTALFALLIITVAVPETGAFDAPDFTEARGATRTGTVRDVALERTVSRAGTVITERFDVEIGGETVVSERSYIEGQQGIRQYQVGDRVLVTASEGPAGVRYGISDHARGSALLLLLLLFGVLVIFVGRWHGIGSLIGLGASALVIWRFVIPGILAGHDPVVIAIIGSTVLVTTTLLLAHGPNLKTALAVVSTALSLLLTGVLARVAVQGLELGGLADEDSALLGAVTGGTVDPQGLLLAGFVIGALGVLDDVTATQVSAVSELSDANASLGRLELYRRAMNIGRDHVASTVNTLVLAYAGAALPLILLISVQQEAIGVLFQRELVATEVARTMAGSIGIVSAVPISTALAALVFGRSRTRISTGEAPEANPRHEAAASHMP
ncbi:MAG: YibE/F family protein [Chloroflexi bacterium]|nr:YibE/F family protein [Chloroflexota bacterium]MDA1146008.1 YibE/F family protein [Chloroflexota bacterium]